MSHITAVLRLGSTAVRYAVRQRTIIANASDSHRKYFCKPSDSESICLIGKEFSVYIS